MTPLAIVVCPGLAPEWAGARRDHLPHLPSMSWAQCGCVMFIAVILTEGKRCRKTLSLSGAPEDGDHEHGLSKEHHFDLFPAVLFNLF